jgi:hypothetical protein
MALRKCKQCGHDVATSARACPGCGAKQTTFITKAVLLLIGLGAFAAVVAPKNEDRSGTIQPAYTRDVPGQTSSSDADQETQYAERATARVADSVVQWMGNNRWRTKDGFLGYAWGTPREDFNPAFISADTTSFTSFGECIYEGRVSTWAGIGILECRLSFYRGQFSAVDLKLTYNRDSYFAIRDSLLSLYGKPSLVAGGMCGYGWHKAVTDVELSGGGDCYDGRVGSQRLYIWSIELDTKAQTN